MYVCVCVCVCVCVRLELYLYPPSGPHRARNGNTLPLYIYIYIYMCWAAYIRSSVCTLSAVFTKLRNPKFGSALNQDIGRILTEQDKRNWHDSQCRICDGKRQHCNKFFFTYIGSALSVIISPRFISWEERVYYRASCSTDSLTQLRV